MTNNQVFLFGFMLKKMQTLVFKAKKRRPKPPFSNNLTLII